LADFGRFHRPMAYTTAVVLYGRDNKVPKTLPWGTPRDKVMSDELMPVIQIIPQPIMYNRSSSIIIQLLVSKSSEILLVQYTTLQE